jgi:hypothetical protein
LKSSLQGLFLFQKIEKSLEGIDNVNREVVEGPEWDAMPKTVILAVLRELVHCHDRGALFLQSTFLVICSYASLTSQNFQIISLINCLAHCNELMIKNTMIMFSFASVLVLFGMQ